MGLLLTGIDSSQGREVGLDGEAGIFYTQYLGASDFYPPEFKDKIFLHSKSIWLKISLGIAKYSMGTKIALCLKLALC